MILLHRAAEPKDDKDSGGGGPSGGIIFLIILIVALVCGAIGWVIYTQLRARRLGLPSPGWRSYIPFLPSNRRTHHTASLEPSRGFNLFSKRSNSGYDGAGTRSARSRAAFDPDQAWDTRIEEEEELEYRPPTHTGAPSGGSIRVVDKSMKSRTGGLGGNDGEEERGRSRSRDGRNPFEEDARREEGWSESGVRGGRPSIDSRRSAFREDIG